MTTLRTPRLVLGPHREDDVAALHAWWNDAEILAMSADDPTGIDLDGARRVLARWMTPRDDVVHFAIRPADDPRLVGFAHLAKIDRVNERCNLGFVLGEKALWGRGYATEAVRAVVGHAFGALGLRRVAAEAYSTNPASIRVLEKVGFRREGVLRAHVRRGEAFVDEIVFGMLRSDRPRASG